MDIGIWYTQRIRNIITIKGIIVMNEKIIKASDSVRKRITIYIAMFVTIAIAIFCVIYMIAIWDEYQTNRGFAIAGIIVFIDIMHLIAIFYVKNQSDKTKILFGQNSLYVPGPKWITAGVVQFETIVEYRKVIGMKLTYSHATSILTEPNVPSGAAGSEKLVMKPYIELYTRERKIERILLRGYTKKQIKEMLTQIKARVSQHNSMLADIDIDEMLNNFKFTFKETDSRIDLNKAIEKYRTSKNKN